MKYWLMKSEPGTWSWDDQVKSGDKGAEWDGVRNYQANNNMKAMKNGDRVFFYHSVDEKRVVGVCEVIKEWYPDPTSPKPAFGMVDIRAIEPMPNPVTLADIKAEPKLSELPLIRQSRLSVLPVDAPSWKLICKMGGLKP